MGLWDGCAMSLSGGADCFCFCEGGASDVPKSPTHSKTYNATNLISLEVGLCVLSIVCTPPVISILQM